MTDLTRIDDGPVATVYSGHRAGVPVAVKVFPKRFDKRTMSAFTKEQAKLSTVRRITSILMVDGVEEMPSGESALRMELCTQSLAGLVERVGPLSAPDVAILGRAMATALTAAHGVGVIHGGVSPSNVLFRDSNEPVVSDFGITLRQAFTRDPLHAIEYLPPETLRTGTLNELTDLYGLGAVLHFALTARSPHPGRLGEQPGERVLRILGEPVPAINRSDVPVALSTLVARLLATTPDRRPQEAAQVAAQLTAMLPTQPPPPPSEDWDYFDHPTPAPPPPQEDPLDFDDFAIRPTGTRSVWGPPRPTSPPKVPPTVPSASSAAWPPPGPLSPPPAEPHTNTSPETTPPTPPPAVETAPPSTPTPSAAVPSVPLPSVDAVLPPPAPMPQPGAPSAMAPPSTPAVVPAPPLAEDSVAPSPALEPQPDVPSAPPLPAPPLPEPSPDHPASEADTGGQPAVASVQPEAPLLPLAPPPIRVPDDKLVTVEFAVPRRAGGARGEFGFEDDFGGIRRAAVLAGPLTPPEQPGRRLIRYDLLAGIALLLALLALVPLLLLRGDPDEMSSTPRVPAAEGVGSGGEVTVELAQPTDLTDKVQLSWKATRELDFAVVVAAEGEDTRVLLADRNHSMTVDIEPGRKYCFMIQASDGDRVYESEPQPLRGATCRK